MYTIGICFIVLLIIVYFITPTTFTEQFFQVTSKKEEPKKTIQKLTIGQPVNLPEAVYSIKNFQNVDLTSSAFTPVQCNNFEIGTMKPSHQKDWLIKPVTPGVYQLFKPKLNECLYAGIDNQLKSYFWNEANCGKRQNICGLEVLNNMNELDDQSMPTYWKIVLTMNNSGVLLQSMDSKKYVCQVGPEVSLKTEPDLSCVFKINKSV